MARYNTGNPIDSNAMKDLSDNAQNLDVLVNSKTALTQADRLGVERKTWHGMEKYVEQSIAFAGYVFSGDYASGVTLTSYNQVVRDSNGEFWRVSGQVDLPYVTTGAGIPEGDALVPVGDAVLRQDLANPDKGAAMIGTASGERLDERLESMDSAIHDKVASVSQASELASISNPINGQKALTGGSQPALYEFDGDEWVKIAQYDKPVDLRGSVDFGNIELPPDFSNNLSFDLWRGGDGRIQHNFDFDRTVEGFKNYYVSPTGNEGNDGLTPEAPKAHMANLIVAIEGDPSVSEATINIVGPYISRDRALLPAGFSISKKLCIRAYETGDRAFIGDINAPLAWTLHSGGTYKSVRTTVADVYDTDYAGTYGLPGRLTKAASLVECTTTPGSWFQSGGDIYVHRKSGTIPDASIFVVVEATVAQYALTPSGQMYLKNLTVLNGGADQALLFSSATSQTSGHVLLDGVTVAGGFGGGNGISTTDISSIWSFNCTVFDVGADGFNYHAPTDGNSFAFEYNCFAYDCGESGEVSENVTTAHDGIRVLRIGTTGGGSYGPCLADVNGCYSICYDCRFGESLHPIIGDAQRAAFRFSDSASTHDPAPNGKAILYNCSGGSATTYGISADSSFSSHGKITVKNFEGVNILTGLDIKIL